MFFEEAKTKEKNLKEVKMTQIISIAWAIVNAFWPKMIQHVCFLHQQK
jgi:hypothetical protein